MKYPVLIITLMLLLFRNVPVNAQCNGPSLWINVWPDERVATIQPTQIFRFRGSNDHSHIREEIVQFGHATQVYLWSAHDSVSLVILDRRVDAANYTDMLLRPERPLLLGKQYELRARRDTTNLFSLFMNKPERPRATIYRWQVTPSPDVQAPTWLATPVVVEKKYSTNSEGIDNYVIFSNPLRDSSACLIKVIIRHADNSQQTTSYITPVRDGRLAIGWFTCGGQIQFKPAEWYTVTFEAIDAAGNRATTSGTAVSFQAPTRPLKSEW